mgnify:CR=1 FL=1
MQRILSIIFLAVSPFLMGFSLDNAIVPRSEVLSGGPPKDGIPALLDPVMVSAEEAGYLDADDEILGVVIAGQPLAYPIKILNWHEVVNDAAGDTPFAVTF